jgi:hypothetical protein
MKTIRQHFLRIEYEKPLPLKAIEVLFSLYALLLNFVHDLILAGWLLFGSRRWFCCDKVTYVSQTLKIAVQASAFFLIKCLKLV